MSVENEIKSAKKLRCCGFALVFVSFVFILASFVLSVYDFAELNGWWRLQNLTSEIYVKTQIPVLGVIWDIAARPRLSEPVQVHNLWFLCEIIIFLGGAGMVAGANKTLSDIASAAHDAKQQHRKDQFQKQQQEKFQSRI
jgi:hypothetical protein